MKENGGSMRRYLRRFVDPHQLDAHGTGRRDDVRRPGAASAARTVRSTRAISLGSIRCVGSAVRCRRASRIAPSVGSRASAHEPAADFEQWTRSSLKRQIRHAVRTISSAYGASSVSVCQRFKTVSPYSSTQSPGTSPISRLVPGPRGSDHGLGRSRARREGRPRQDGDAQTWLSPCGDSTARRAPLEARQADSTRPLA
jgi:hypothetical protein